MKSIVYGMDFAFILFIQDNSQTLKLLLLKS